MGVLLVWAAGCQCNYANCPSCAIGCIDISLFLFAHVHARVRLFVWSVVVCSNVGRLFCMRILISLVYTRCDVSSQSGLFFSI
jgi:hypothetical protein